MPIKRFAISLLKYGALFVALTLTAGISALTTMRVVLRSQEVVVPALVGKRVPEAGGITSGHRLMLRVEGRRNDPKVPPDRIVAQEPPAGSTLKRQRSIRVWVSLGPRRLTVPAVEGESIRTGRISLEQAQVPVGRVVEVNDGSDEGTILIQHPPPGDTETLDAEGAAMLVSLGPASSDFVMPDLIGRSAAGVLDALGRVGLKVTEVRYRSYPGVAPGTVLRQAPPAGFRVGRRTTVSLEVSRVE
ncbi:MAG TPA: PASTA domain-containing protein [Vicinamibacteria bacterium]|nr:PASTA domain-containing protein [Vicinamibacteria bacterium]